MSDLNANVEECDDALNCNSSDKTKSNTSEVSETMKRSYLMECCPVKSLEDLYTVVSDPPPWVNRILERENRSASVVQNVMKDCHIKEDDISVKLRLDSKFVPKTLVCHDYKGGYLEDRYLIDVNIGNLYTFYNWNHIDIFVYFSHHFITIPPLCWINAAHKNGVKILGTIITEFKDGESICAEIFKDIPTMQAFTRNLAKVAEIFKFDGYLLNIENILPNTIMLKAFVGYLTACIHQINPENVILWYDSVTYEGKLEWQNELNEKNMCFFDLCDGIFLNYVWTENSLIRSLKTAKHRARDVFAGVDVFGRNTFGGGRFDCYKAAEVIRRHGLSMAIFAPGWTHETLDSTSDTVPIMEQFLNKDCAFWNSLWPYLYTHPVTNIFETCFFKGADSNHYNMFQQQLQLTKIVHPKYVSLLPEYAKVPTLNNKCGCLRLEYIDNRSLCRITKENLTNAVYIHHLFTCDINIQGQIVVYFITKIQTDSVLGLQILTCGSNDSNRKYILHGTIRPSILMNTTLMQINPTADGNILNSLKRFYDFLLNSGNMELKAYSFFVEPCKILEINAVLEEGDSICMGAFGIRNMTTFINNI